MGSIPLGPPLGRPSSGVAGLLSPQARAHVIAYRLDPDIERRFINEKPITAFAAPPASVMLSQGGVPLVWARWPQTGYAQVAAIPGPSQTPVFAVPPEASQAWRAEPALRAGGFWSYDWAYETVRLSIDPQGATAAANRLSAPFPVGKHFRYFVYNAVSALNAPGEFAVSPATHELLVWPLQERSDAPPVRLVKADHLLQIENAHNVTFEGIEFSDALDTAVTVKNSQGVVLRDDLVANAGGAGIVVSGGQDDRIERSVIADVGASGVVLSGGDRRTLAPGGDMLRDSIVVRASQRARTGHAAVQLLGVQNAVLGCIITDAPHWAVQFGGNDQRIAFNDISHAVTDTADAGAVYIGRDVTALGDSVDHNVIHDIYALPGSPQDVRGVYLDDFTSGVRVVGNTFVRVRDAVFVNGGSDNVIAGNTFVQSTGAPVTLRVAGSRKAEYKAVYTALRANGAAAFGNPDLYKRRYPSFSLPDPGGPGEPKNTVHANVMVGSDGAITPLDPATVGGTDDLNLTAADARDLEPRRQGSPDLSGLRFFARARLGDGG